jgi:hypothetical protein
MFEKQNMIITALEKHFSKCWLGIDFDYHEILPKRIAFILIRDVTTGECQFLSRNYRKNDLVFLYPNLEPFVDEDLLNSAKVKHLLYTDPDDVYFLPDDAKLQLPFNN